MLRIYPLHSAPMVPTPTLYLLCSVQGSAVQRSPLHTPLPTYLPTYLLPTYLV